MFEVAKGTSTSYPTILKWANSGKVHHAIEKRISKYIKKMESKELIREMQKDYDKHANRALYN